MNNNNKQINEALQWLQSTGQSLIDITSEQAPLYCREVLNWTFYSNMIIAIVGILWIIGSIFLISPCIKALNFEYGKDMKNAVMVVAFFFIPITIFSVVDMVKVKVAPRIVLVEHFKHKVK